MLQFMQQEKQSWIKKKYTLILWEGVKISTSLGTKTPSKTGFYKF